MNQTCSLLLFLIDLFAVMNLSIFFSLFSSIQNQNFYCPIDGNFLNPPFYTVKKLLHLMEPPTTASATPCPSRAIFLPSEHTKLIRGAHKCRGCLSLSIGSQWILHLPNQGNGSRCCNWRSIWNLGFPVGQYSCRRGILRS